jgi:cyanate permease
MAILTLFFLAGIAATIYLRIQYPTEQRWTGALVLTGIVGVFMLIAWIMKERGKK